jgi:AmmeMemoRadiSam system protein B
MQRQPAVAGQFYTGNPEELRRNLEILIPVREKRNKVTGIIAPHAGYIYSGAVAGKVYGLIEMPGTVLVLGPNHRGAGAAAGLYPDGEWLTPLGAVPVNSHLNTLLLQNIPFLQSDTLSHQFEHSLEVQLPFIRFLRRDVSIAALCLGSGDFAAIEVLGIGIAAAIRAYGDEVLIVASSDMTHYESAAEAKRKDDMALERILAFDPEGLLSTCRSEHITMCGVVPSAVMMVAARELGATHAELISYGTSGDVTGDNRKVVGYASVTIW